jgi:hypothetical protein
MLCGVYGDPRTPVVKINMYMAELRAERLRTLRSRRTQKKDKRFQLIAIFNVIVQSQTQQVMRCSYGPLFSHVRSTGSQFGPVLRSTLPGNGPKLWGYLLERPRTSLLPMP